MSYNFAVIGDPIDKSQSPSLFRKIWSNNTLNSALNYSSININESQLEEFLATTDLDGFNVTAPLKEAIIPHLSRLTPIAKNIKAVNTVVKINQQWNGHNTDGEGFWKMCKDHLPTPAKSSDICVLGNGGAARAIVYILNSLGYRGLILCRRAKGNFDWPEVEFDSIKELKATAVIQCTTLGMSPHIDNSPPLPIWLGKNKPVAFDLIYEPAETKFIKEMEFQGCKTIGGSQMLIFQAKKTWEYWVDVLNIPQI